MLAFMAMVQQWRGLKIQPHRVQQAQAHLPEVYRMPITYTSVFWIRSNGHEYQSSIYFVTA